MAIRRLVILKHVGKTPFFAACELCHLKFFTSRDMERDSVGAEQHMRYKFDIHTCKNAGDARAHYTKKIDDHLRAART